MKISLQSSGRAGVAAALVFAWGALAAQTPPDPGLVLTNVRVEVGNGKVVESATVVVFRGRIAGLVPTGSSIEVPPDAKSVDGRGLTLYPGFIDAYSTRGVNLPAIPARGTPPNSVTNAPAFMWPENRKGIRAEVDAGTGLDLKPTFRESWSQGITVVQVAPGSGTVRGRCAIAWVAENGGQAILKPLAAMEIAQRAGQGEGYPGSLLGVIAMLRQTLYDAQGYDPAAEKKDAALEALRPAATGTQRVVFSADSDREVFRATRVVDEFGLRGALAGARDGWRYAEELKKRNLGAILRLDVGTEPTSAGEAPAALLEERRANWKERAENAARLAAAGIQIGFSSDGDPIAQFLANVRRAIANGLPREAALKALTSDAAGLLELGSELGTVEVGKRASLVLMDGDFAKEGTTVKMVIVDGKLEILEAAK